MCLTFCQDEAVDRFTFALWLCLGICIPWLTIIIIIITEISLWYFNKIYYIYCLLLLLLLCMHKMALIQTTRKSIILNTHTQNEKMTEKVVTARWPINGIETQVKNGNEIIKQQQKYIRFFCWQVSPNLIFIDSVVRRILNCVKFGIFFLCCVFFPLANSVRMRWSRRRRIQWVTHSLKFLIC